MKNKFVKILFVALAVMSVFVSSCVSVFAADDINSIDRDKLVESIRSNESINSRLDKYKYFVFILEQYGNGYRASVYYTNHIKKVYQSYGHYELSFSDKDRALYTYSVVDSQVSGDGVYFNNVAEYWNVTVENSDNLVLNSIVYSNYDIYDTDNKLFFQKPPGLLQRLLNLVQPNLGEKITGDLGILTTCGIGCLALLIGLSLLPKVLYKFL